MIRLSLWIFVISCALMVVFGGCRSFTPPVTYYMLSSISGPTGEANVHAKVADTIGIRPVELPGYIDRTQMVTRTGTHRLAISATHRWADYPDRLVQQIIGDNLQALMPSARVVDAPWPMGLKPDVTLSFQFMELIGTADKKMQLSAVWTIIRADSPSAVQSRRTTFEVPMRGSGFDDLAAAHSQVLEALCREVAKALVPSSI